MGEIRGFANESFSRDVSGARGGDLESPDGKK
jgi:hypothetical protein